MATISVSEQLSSIGAEIQGMESSFQEILDNIASTVTEIASVWDGLGHTAFDSDYNTQQKTLSGLPQTVGGLGKAVSQTAQTWEELESKIGQR